MQGLQTNKKPSTILVLPHYVSGSLFFLVLSILVYFSSDAFSGHYFHPKILSITHIAALGWATMIIFGASYQLLPVILEVSIYSEFLAKITFFTFTAGVILLAWSFWNFQVGIHIQVASSLLLLSFLFFFINMLVTARKTAQWTIEADFIVTSFLWLLFTGLLGTMMAFNFRYSFLDKSHILYLKIHAHMGIAGWFILLIMGVGSKLIPMFLLAHNLNSKKLKYAYYLVNIGLIGLFVDLFYREEKALGILYAIIIATGILFFLSFIKEAYIKRVRKRLDTGLKHSFMAFIFLLTSLLIGILINIKTSMDDKFLMRIYLVYGTLIFLGFISSLILGQTFKTLPFIVWVDKYGKSTGKQNTFLPKDLFSEKTLKIQYVVYFFSISVLIIGILVSMPVVIRAGATLLIITAILYNLNVLKIVAHSFKKSSK